MKKMLLVGATLAALTVVTAAVVLAFSVTGSDTNATATTNCNPAIDVSVGSAGPLIPGVQAYVPVTVSDPPDDCVGVGATITSVTANVAGVPGCVAGWYTLGAVTLSNVPSGGSVVMQVPITLKSAAPDGCKGATAGLTVAVVGTVP